ncbi:hypothetical protein ACFW04_006885 [Cataglyphis niger]
MFGIGVNFATDHWYFSDNSSVDQAYFQIPLERNSRKLTAFTVPGKSLFHFTRMPLSLTGAPATFQRLLDRLIGPEMEPHAFAYLDDIVVVTRTFEEHLVWLKRVLDRIKGADLTINPEKRLKVDPDKTAPLVEYLPPKNIKQLPVKSCIISPPTLSCPKFELPFVLQTDTSLIGLGVVLTQESEGLEYVIALASRALSEAGKYFMTEQECLALHNLKNPTGRLARWALDLLEYDYEIEHRKGTSERDTNGTTRACKISKASRVNNRIVESRTTGYISENRILSQVVDDLEQWKLVFPKDLRRDIIRTNHDIPQAKNYIRRCDTCQRTKLEQNVPAGLMGRRKVDTPVVVPTDITGPFFASRIEFAYLLVIQDLFTKWVECCPLRRAKGKKICEVIEDLIINRWRIPRVLLTDNKTEFVNRDLKAFAEEHDLMHITTISPASESGGASDHRDWDVHLAEFRFAYNLAYHMSLQATPAFFKFR